MRKSGTACVGSVIEIDSSYIARTQMHKSAIGAVTLQARICWKHAYLICIDSRIEVRVICENVAQQHLLDRVERIHPVAEMWMLLAHRPLSKRHRRAQHLQAAATEQRGNVR